MWLTPAPRLAAASDLAETTRYRASVTDISGQAIPGAVVKVYEYRTQGRGANPELVTNVTSGADGKFEVVLRHYSFNFSRFLALGRRN